MKKYKEQKKLLKLKVEEKLNKLYIKSDVIFLADVFEKFIKISTEEYGINPYIV